MIERRRLVLVLLANLAFLIIAAALVEGFSSFIMATREVAARQPRAEARHTQYDPELGWVNRPGVTIPDLYGPGRTLTINRRGFRTLEEVDSLIPPGRIRGVCSGDSFTLGYGVADAETWCARLTARDSALRTVNMGQGGYGVDQAYLWYKRDGAAFQHNFHIFAFITDDFRRMQKNAFMGYPKPRLEVATDGQLAVRNVPVQKRGNRLRSSLIQNEKKLASLRTVQLAKWLAKHKSRGSRKSEQIPVVSQRGQNVFRLVMADLKSLNDQRASRLMLVYFPSSYDLYQDEADSWRTYISAEAERLNVPFLDLFPLFRSMTREEYRALYIPDGLLDYPGASGHFTAEGNDLVAGEIYKFMVERGFLNPSNP